MTGFFVRTVTRETVRTIAATGLGLSIYHSGLAAYSMFKRTTKQPGEPMAEKNSTPTFTES